MEVLFNKDIFLFSSEIYYTVLQIWNKLHINLTLAEDSSSGDCINIYAEWCMKWFPDSPYNLIMEQLVCCGFYVDLCMQLVPFLKCCINVSVVFFGFEGKHPWSIDPFTCAAMKPKKIKEASGRVKHTCTCDTVANLLDLYLYPYRMNTSQTDWLHVINNRA
jgi:hypothetical protein